MSALLEPESLYGLSDMNVFPAGDGTSLVYLTGSRRAIISETSVLRALRAIKYPATREVLRERLATTGEGGEEAIASVVRDGLVFEDAESLPVAEPAEQTRTSPISVIGIPTRNRPSAVRRLLRTLRTEPPCQRPELTTLVLDDSTDVTASLDLERIVDAEREQHQRVIYIGPAQRRHFIRRLAKESGIDHDLLTFALDQSSCLEGSWGAGRNTLLLAAAGQSILQLDDDFLCGSIVQTPEAAPGLALSSAADYTQFWFFSDDLPRVDHKSLCTTELLRVYEEVLGRSVNDLLVSNAESGLDVSHLARRSRTRLCRRGGTIVGAMLGCCGDPGVANLQYPLLSGPSHIRLTQSESYYRKNIWNRNILRSVCRPTLSDGAFCLAGNLALDASRLLPPFFPVYRGEDTNFGLLRATCLSGDAFMAMLPWSLCHRPVENREVPATCRILTGNRLGLQEIVGAFIATTSGMPFPTEHPITRLVRLGMHLQDVGRSSELDFMDELQTNVVHLMAARLAYCEDLLKSNQSKPDYWACDVAAYMSSIRDMVKSHRSCVPVDIQDKMNPSETGLSLKESIGKFGDLLQAWPTLLHAAARLRARDGGVFQANV